MASRHHPSDIAEADRLLAALTKLSATAGVDVPGLEPAAEALGRARRFAGERRQRREDSSAVISRLGEALGSGAIDLDEMAIQAAAHDAWDNTSSTAYRVVDAAESYAVRTALRGVKQALPTEMLEQIREGVARAVAEVRKLRPVLEGIRSAGDATAAGVKAAKAWATYLELIARWDALHELAGTLRRVGWLEDVHHDHPTEARFGRPDLRTDDLAEARRERRPAPLELLDVVTDRWRAGGPFTAEELERNREPMRERLEIGRRQRGYKVG